MTMFLRQPSRWGSPIKISTQGTTTTRICGRKGRRAFLVSIAYVLSVVMLATNLYAATLFDIGSKHKVMMDAKEYVLDKQRVRADAQSVPNPRGIQIVEDPSAPTSNELPARRVKEEEEDVVDPWDVVPAPSVHEKSNLEVPTQRQLQQGEKEDAKSGQAYFIKKGKDFYVTSRDALDLHDKLPAGTYSIGINPMSGEYFLTTIDPFEIHGKVYGDTKRQSDRILSTFLDRRGSTGVLLSGEKGSGKTFLAKYIAIEAAQKHQIPTVVVNQPLSGERFNAFVQSIQQPTIFLFDEFEKIYAEKDPSARRREEEMQMELAMYDGPHRPDLNRLAGGNYNQDSMLTLLDGTYTTKMLFILTTNTKYRVSNHMRNRPGRIFYVIDFAGLSADFVKEYCNDKLQDKTKIPQVLAVSGLFEAFSFDMLQAMVEEMNRYGETPEQVLDFLNVRPEFATGSRYAVKLVVDGQEIPQRNLHSGKQWFGNPLVSVVQLFYEKPRARKPHGIQPPAELTPDMQEKMAQEMMMEELNREDSRGEIEFTAKDMDGMDATTGTFWYWNEEKKARLILTKEGKSAGQSTNGSLLHRLSQLRAGAPNGE